MSIAGLILVTSLVYSDGPNPSSLHIVYFIALLVLSVALAGIYLVHNYCKSTKKMTKIQIYVIGFAFAVYGILTAFNVVDFLGNYNWVIAIGIVYVMLVQLQLLNWGYKTGSVVKISSVLLMIADLFLVIFFIVKWSSPSAMMWLNIAISISLLAFALGLSFLPRKYGNQPVEGQINT